MAVELYDTLTLVDVIRNQAPFDEYWGTFFPRQINFQTEEILFDVVAPDRRMAPFVAPNVQGKVVALRGYSTKTFKPAYIKPKFVIDPSQTIARLAGEQPLGQLTLEQRWDANVAESTRLGNEQIRRRWEWMSARALIDGAVTVSGENYPAVTVNFGRDGSLTVTLTGTAKWDGSAADPLGDLQAIRLAVRRLAFVGITRLTFGLDAWDAFSKNADVRALLSNQMRGSGTDYNTAVPEGTPFEYRGVLQGSNGVGKLELYTYNDQYEDETGTLQDFLDAGTVVGTSGGLGIQGTRCFGAIKDKRAGLQSLPIFPKMYDVEDPSATYLLLQSAPLMVPAQPNGSFTMKVV